MAAETRQQQQQRQQKMHSTENNNNTEFVCYARAFTAHLIHATRRSHSSTVRAKRVFVSFRFTICRARQHFSEVSMFGEVEIERESVYRDQWLFDR